MTTVFLNYCTKVAILRNIEHLTKEQVPTTGSLIIWKYAHLNLSPYLHFWHQLIPPPYFTGKTVLIDNYHFLEELLSDLYLRKSYFKTDFWQQLCREGYD